MRSLLNPRICDAGITKRERARRVGVSEDTVGRWARDDGIEKATLGKLGRVAEALDCGICDLFDE